MAHQCVYFTWSQALNSFKRALEQSAEAYLLGAPGLQSAWLIGKDDDLYILSALGTPCVTLGILYLAVSHLKINK